MEDVTYEVSAGGIVVRGQRVLVIRTRTQRGRTVWTFPKGRLESGESHDEAAVREVREETGYTCSLQRPLGATTYWYRRSGLRVKKTVHWFLFEPGSKTGRHNPEEVQEVRWIPIGQAYEKLAHRGDRKLLASVEAQLGGAIDGLTH